MEYVLDVKRVEVPVTTAIAYLPLYHFSPKPSPVYYLTDRETQKLMYDSLAFTLEYFEEVGIVSFVLSLLYALDGDEDIYECCFVESKVVTDLPFFGSIVKLGKMGLEAVIEPDLEGLTKFVAQILKYLKRDLEVDIEKRIMFANKTRESY